jgi:hypothetical protein
MRWKSGNKHTVPSQVDTHETGEPNQSVSHECNTTALGRRAEESNLGLLRTKLLGVDQHGFPSCGTAGIFVILNSGKVGTESGVGLNDATESDLEKGNEGGTEIPGNLMLAEVR